MLRSTLLALGAAIALAQPASALTIIDLDGRVHASTDGKRAVTITLPKGQYEVRFTQGLFTAHNRFDGRVAGCNALGTNCTRGWETNARFFLGDNDFVTGNDFRIGNFTYHDSRERAFAAAADFATRFVVPAGGSEVSFYIYDPKISDNVGGVSLAVAAIPEAATWAMMIAGFGLVGAALRRRRTVAAA
jgi:hypothetical protein